MTRRAIHLLYVPTLACNLGCRYCYLGTKTTEATLKTDAARAVETLRHTLAALDAADVLAFNVSLHGGEVTTLPEEVLDALFTTIRGHYLKHFDELTALGFKKSAPHIKTNLFRFAPLLDLFDRHKVSISASIDLPLKLHGEYRTTLGGRNWLAETRENIALLARYPHARKISATLCSEHLADIPALIDDIRFIHRELGFDMTNLNLMFAFASELNRARVGEAALTPATPEQQWALYQALKTAFAGTELEEGFLRNWFDEFKPSYCTHAFNCGERFYLLQSDGTVWSCVRGQGIPEFRYGNVFEDDIPTILANGARRIAGIHQAHGFDTTCRTCEHLALCHTGCPVVKHQQRSGRSYTCELQKAIYADQPHTFPATPPAERAGEARAYALAMHPALALAAPVPADPVPVLTPELADTRNALSALIAADPHLQALYRDDAFVLEIGDDTLPLTSQLLKYERLIVTLGPSDPVRIHVRRALFEAACEEPIRNTLYVQLLRDTAVVYGDERRSKQEHVFTYQIFRNCLEDSRLGPDFASADLGGLLALHRSHYRRGVANNLFFTTQYLRDYHYQKQKANAFYHIQAINLPFQNLEFHYLPGADA